MLRPAGSTNGALHAATTLWNLSPPWRCMQVLSSPSPLPPLYSKLGILYLGKLPLTAVLAPSKAGALLVQAHYFGALLDQTVTAPSLHGHR